MKSIMIIAAMIGLCGCAAFETKRTIVGDNTLISSNYPSIKITVNDGRLKPVAPIGAKPGEFAFTGSGFSEYSSAFDNGGTFVSREEYLFADVEFNRARKLLVVSFFSLPKSSVWRKEINTSGYWFAGPMDMTPGKYETGIYQDKWDNIVDISFNVDGCYLNKTYQYIEPGVKQKKMIIVYSERIYCTDIPSYKDQYGLTDEGKALLQSFDMRANKSFTIDEFR